MASMLEQRPDLAILAANTGALGIVANFSGLKVFEDIDVRIPIALYSLGAILALVATFAVYAFSRRIRRRFRNDYNLPGPRQSLRIAALASAVFATSIAMALLLRGVATWVSSGLLLLAALAALTVIGLVYLASQHSGPHRQTMGTRVVEKLNFGGFAALIVGSVLLLAPGITRGVEAGMDFTPPPPPEPYETWRRDLLLNQSNTVNTRVSVTTSETRATDDVEKTVERPNQPCPAVNPAPPGRDGRDGRDGICRVLSAAPPPPCPAICIRGDGKPFNAELEQVCSACEDTSSR